jgi:DNA polymerase III epsilon subunit-like protein
VTVWIFDIEADNLLDSVSKIHCIVAKEFRRQGFTDLGKVRDGDILIGHNIIGYDLPAMEKVLGIKYRVSYDRTPDRWNGMDVQIIDTYILSRLFNPDREGHGLEWWGEQVGISKPEVQDWQDLPLESYIHRCEQDVLINERMLEALLREQGITLEDVCGEIVT